MSITNTPKKVRRTRSNIIPFPELQPVDTVLHDIEHRHPWLQTYEIPSGYGFQDEHGQTVAYLIKVEVEK